MTRESDSARDRRLDEVVTAFLKAMEAGESPEPREWLTRHPDLAPELSAFFEAQKHVAAMVDGEASESEATIGLDGQSVRPEPRRVRYFGDYELLEEIARGGMGVVYRAKQVSLNRVVALKMILKGELASEADVRRFRQEAEAAANLDHPNIVPIYEVGEQEGQQYFSMKLIESGPTRERLEPREAATMLVKVARAVHHAHQRGILHRDLKPRNILIDSHGEPHVADFGLAKKVEGGEDATRSGAIVGTPAYMAPEQARAEKSLTTAVDVYSLGAILYEWLTGRPPFSGEDALLTLMRVLNDEPAKPRSINAKVNRDLETICLKCLEKAPSQRYSSASDLADDLERFLRGEPISAHPLGRVERAARWVMRYPVHTAVWALLILTLVVGTAGGVALWQWDRAESARQEAVLATSEAEEARDSERVLRVEIEQARDSERQQRERAEREHQRAEQVVYNGQIANAQRAVERWDMIAAWRLLGATRPDLRGWEYDYLHAQVEARHHTVKEVEFRLLTFNPDRTRMVSPVSPFPNGTAKVFDTATGKVTVTLQHGKQIRGIEFSPDGQQVVSIGDDSMLRLWDAATGAEKRAIPLGTDKVGFYVFSPDGKQIAFRRENSNEIQTLNAKTGAALTRFKGHSQTLHSILFSHDGKRLATTSGDLTIKLWDSGTGANLLTLSGHTSLISHPAFSPDDKLLVSGSHDGTVKLWDMTTGKLKIAQMGHRVYGPIYCVAFSPDGKQVAGAGNDGAIYLWDAVSGHLLAELKGHSTRVFQIAYGPGGDWLLSHAQDNTLQRWNLRENSTPPGVKTPHVQSGVGTVALSPDGKRVVTTGHGEADLAYVWDATTKEKLFSLKIAGGYFIAAIFSPDGKRIAGCGRNRVAFWDAGTGAELSSWPVPADRSPFRLAYHPGGHQIAGVGGKPTLWDARSGKVLLDLPMKASPSYSVVFSNDGHRIAYSDHVGFQVVDAATGTLLSRFKLEGIIRDSLAVSGNADRVLTGSRDGTLHLFDITTGAKLKEFVGHTSITTGVVWNAENTRIWSISDDGALKLWDTATGGELLTLRGHAGRVNSLAISRDGRRIVTGGFDGMLRFWEAPPSRKNKEP